MRERKGQPISLPERPPFSLYFVLAAALVFVCCMLGPLFLG